MNKIKKSILVVSLFFIIAFLFYYIEHTNYTYVSKNGVLDLSNWNYEEVVFLSGEWDFYWQNFIFSDDLREDIIPHITAKVPSVWNNYIINNKKLPGQGYATYVLHIKGVTPEQPLAFRIKPFSSSYELFINDTSIAKCGTISTIKKSSRPEYKLQIITFTPKSNCFDIILHISNYSHAYGGAWYPLQLGTIEQIEKLSSRSAFIDFVLLGAYLQMILYLLSIYIIFKKKGPLFLLLLCIITILRNFSYGNFLLSMLLPEISYEAIIRVTYLFFNVPGLYVFYINSEYPGLISKNFKHFLYCIALIFTLAVFCLPIIRLTQIQYLLDAISLGIIVYSLQRTIYAVRHKLIGSLFLLFGIIILFIASIYDICMMNNILHKSNYIELLPWGIFIFIFTLGYSFIYKSKYFSNERIKLLHELNSSSERERKLELKLLKSQIRPHFINNILTAICSLARTDYTKARYLLVEFSKYLQSCYDVGRLEDTVPIENELSLIYSYLILEKARFGNKIKIYYDIDDVSISLPPLMLQPLVENAVTHGMKKGGNRISILVFVKKLETGIKIGVRDNGTGISETKIHELLESNSGIGSIGIYNINQRLKKMYNTSLQIKITENKYTDIYMIIPKEYCDL